MLITRAAGWAASVFHEVEVKGARVPDGPVMVIANHPNSLLDPLILFHVAGRPTRPLAKAPLFDQALLGTVLRGLGGLPVYRKQDDPALMHRNEDTFRGAIAALAQGDAVQIYPEGRSHSESALAPLRTGAARIVLAAEAEAGWRLGVRIVPVGLTYTRKARFRGHVLATIGAPFTITALQIEYETDPQAAARTLTERIGDALEAVTLNLPSPDDVALVDVAERIYAREKGLASWREREPMAERLPRMQAFARGMHWLRTYEPDRFAALAHAVRRHQRKLAIIGVTEADVPPAYRGRDVASYVLRKGTTLALGLPLALGGAVLWYPVWLAARLSVMLVKPGHEALATYKLAGGLLAAPLLLALYVALAAWLGGAALAIGVATGAPLLGLIALAWHRTWRRVRDDTSLFAAMLHRGRARHRMAADRAALALAFDDVLDRMQAGQGHADESVVTAQPQVVDL